MNREIRKLRALETLKIIKENGYSNNENEKVEFQPKIEDIVNQTELYSSEELEIKLNSIKLSPQYDTIIEITSEDSVSCIHRLCKESDNEVMCLNFASAKNPGGGFLNGAIAQEESLSLSSALYESQLSVPEFYYKHKKMKSCIYTDSMIYSPHIPVFRLGDGELTNTPSIVTFITSPAVNTGVVIRRENKTSDDIKELMRVRIQKLLALSVDKGHETLILGAWGCGVFQNDPEMIAKLFNEQINKDFKGCFKRIVFAIYSRNDKFINAFREKIKLENEQETT